MNLEEEYAQAIAGLDETTSTYGFLKKYHDRAIGSLKDDLEKEMTWVSADNTGDGVIYKLFEKWGFLEDTEFQKQYKVKGDLNELNLLEERINQHFSRGYDETELIAILRSEAEKTGETPEQRDFNNSNDLPSYRTYHQRFGPWNNALWRARLPTNQETFGEEEILDSIRRKYWEKQEEPKADKIYEDPGMPSSEPIKTQFDTYKQAKKEALTYLNSINSLEK